jgi:cytochrome P450
MSEHNVAKSTAILSRIGTMTELADIQLNSPETSRDAFSIYEQFRAEGGILWSRRHKAWIISTFAFARAVLNSPSSSVEKLAPFTEHSSGSTRAKAEQMQRIMNHWLPFLDPPAHTRMRKILQRGFMARTIEPHEPAIRAITRGILDELEGRETIEFIRDFSSEVPARTIIYLYGLPEHELERIKLWSNGIAEFVLGSANPGRYDKTLAMMQEMHGYFTEFVRSGFDTSANSNDKPGNGSLMRMLLDTREQADGLSDEEIVATLILILFAAPETTANMMLNAMYRLVSQPGALEWLADEPDRIPLALEEAIRFDGPVPTVVRVAKDDMQIGNQTIRAGERIFVLLKSANRDSQQIENPDTLDLDRGRCQHLGFGSGIHLCVGAPLARLEAKIAFEEFLKRYSKIEMAEQEIVWRDELLAHSPKALWLNVSPAGTKSKPE